MEIKDTKVDDILILHLSGRLWNEADSLELMNVIRCPLNDGQRKVIINMDQVPILNSSGLGSLIAAMKQITAAGGRLILVHVHERIMTLLKITKLISVFEIHPTVEDGLQQMRSQ